MRARRLWRVRECGGTGASSVEWYCEMAPQRAMRAWRLMRCSRVSSTSPPTFFEDHVDAVGAGAFERGVQRLGAIVDRRVKVQLVDQIHAFFVAAADANHAAALELGDLAGGAAHGPGGGRDHRGIARARLRHLEHAVVGREPRHSEYAERGRKRRGLTVDDLQGVQVGDGVFLPAELAAHDLALAQARVARKDHLAHALADHHLAECNGLPAQRLLPESPAHVGINGDVDRAHEHLAGDRPGDRRLDDLEVVNGGHARRPARQDYLGYWSGWLDTARARAAGVAKRRSPGAAVRSTLVSIWFMNSRVDVSTVRQSGLAGTQSIER